MERENAFADMGRFLRSEKDVRPYWETQHRGTVLPLVKSGYNDSVEYGVPAILGGQGWQTMSDIVSGRPVSKDEISAGATDVAGGGFTLFGITPRMREEARKGLPLFSAGVPMQYSAPAYDETIY